MKHKYKIGDIVYVPYLDYDYLCVDKGTITEVDEDSTGPIYLVSFSREEAGYWGERRIFTDPSKAVECWCKWRMADIYKQATQWISNATLAKESKRDKKWVEKYKSNYKE